MKVLSPLVLKGPWRTARLRIGATFSLLAVVLFIGVGLLSADVVRQYSERETGAALERLARRLARELDAGMFERFREVRNLAVLEDLLGRQIDAPHWRTVLDSAQQSFSHYSWIGVTDTDGTVLAATGGVLQGRNVAQRPWFAKGREGPYAGDAHEAVLLASLLPKQPYGEPLRLLDFAAPLPRGGVVGAHLNLNWAEERRREAAGSVDPGSGVEIWLLGDGGEVLLGVAGAHPQPSMAQALAGLRHRPALLPWSDGERYLTAAAAASGYRDYPGVGWTVLVRQPERTAMAAAHTLALRIALFGVLGAALFGIGGWWLAGRLTAPLRAVAQQARMATPDSQPPLIDERDEVAQVAASLSALIDQLRQRERDLVGLNQTLEVRVQERTESLRQANDDLSSFSRSVSHDLKGPISSMGMLLKNMLAGDASGTADDQRRGLRILANECDRLVVLIDELLKLAMVDQNEAERRPVSMTGLVDTVLAGLRQQGAGSPQVVVGALPDALGDDVLLRQVWQNLLGNAFKFSAKSAAPTVEVQGRREGNEVVYTVSDNGVGFDPTQGHRLFGVFQRLHRASDYAGTGVGLSIVKRIVHRHGGRVWAESRPEGGARFCFSLPASG